MLREDHLFDADRAINEMRQQVSRAGRAMNQANAQVYGISVDTFFTLKAFHDQQRLTFPLLSDFNKQVIRDYGINDREEAPEDSRRVHGA